MYKNGLEHFEEQFAFRPAVTNRRRLVRKKKYIVCGMGGSHWAADIIKTIRPDLDILIWSSYGLPLLPQAELRDRLVIASSYSGNTEEALSSFDEARRRKLPLAVSALGGKLLARAKKYRVPYVQMPDYQIPPRLALGSSLLSLLALIGDRKTLHEAFRLERLLRAKSYRVRGLALGKRLSGAIPLIYASDRWSALPYIWKIKLNETGKLPAFANVLPEMNHNEMTGFDVGKKAKELPRIFHTIILKSPSEDRRVVKRMALLKKLYEQKGVTTEFVPIAGKTPLHAIFGSLALAEWTSYALALRYAAEPEEVPMVEEFKRLMRAR